MGIKRLVHIKQWIIISAIGISLFVISYITGCNNSGDVAVANEIDYNLHIRPILSDKCFKCHGPDANKRKAGLRLDIADSAYAALKKTPGAHAIIPGNPMQSEVFLRISTQDTSELMPPPASNLALSATEISLIEKWIKQGAKYKPHWAFIVPQPQKMPEVKNKDWAKNEIDFFVLARQEQMGLKPNDEADKEHLLKRLSFDLTGLPPSIEMQEKFLADKDEQAYEKMVDAFLAMPQYGEKMAVSWLDVARYADSHGYQDDGLRTMWPWRDWVIHAFNANYPYDKFVSWQLAGDLMPQPKKEMLLATGFNRNHKITQEGGVIDEEYRIEYVTDRTNTFGKAFLALTFECAKCHDHKYDPISQNDYYSTSAFFNQVAEKGFQGDIQLASLADPPYVSISSDDINQMMNFINKKDTAPVRVMVMKDSSLVRKTYILRRGNYDQHLDEVRCNTPKAILPFDTTKYPQSRLGLAEWVVNKKNPLTARVYVNRLWQEFFGRGLVKTSGDFGMQGEMPSHPELLDWLSLDFMDHGWDIKRLVKQIVMSATYRQSAVITKDAKETDPENIFLSHAPRLRLSAEGSRDMVLASSGLLVKEIGGPSVKTYQPKGLWEASTSGRGQLAKYVQDHNDDLYRRTMYTFIKRTVPPPTLLIFDASNRDQCEVKRLATSTPLQSLVMLNDPQVLEAARVLAERLSKENTGTEEKINKAFQLIVCRKPADKEKELFNNYYTSLQKEFAANTKNAAEFIQAGEYKHEDIKDKATLAALMQVIHTMYNMEEAIVK